MIVETVRRCARAALHWTRSIPRSARRAAIPSSCSASWHRNNAGTAAAGRFRPVVRLCATFVHGFGGHRMPVAHRCDGHGIDVGRAAPPPAARAAAPSASQSASAARSPHNVPATGYERRDEISFAIGRRRSPSGPSGIMSGSRNKIQQKRLNGLQRIRPAELKQHNPDALLPCQAIFPGSANSSAAQSLRARPRSAARR